MEDIDVDFCFYDDPDFSTDADRDSGRLRDCHQRLWGKPLPNGDSLVWDVESGGYLATTRPLGPLRVSSDTIATSHSNYRRTKASRLWADLPESDQELYERTFYTIGGFIIFPVRPQSINQSRGTSPAIMDRFDLTLECIRQHYFGRTDSPLATVLAIDTEYFALFGAGPEGFDSFVDFFHLQDVVAGRSIRWFDNSPSVEWNFGSPPLPSTMVMYRRYLDNVSEFVAARNVRIKKWLEANPQPGVA